jgi:parvulin-like peptidyl-prolyl isomerase
MNKALQIGDVQIACAEVLAQLQGSPLLPQLLQEIATAESIDLIAAQLQLDLTPTPAELDQLSAQVASIATFQGMNPTQITAITTRTLRLQKFKQAGWGSQVSAYYQSVQHQLHCVTYSIIQVEDGLLAQELFFRVQSGEQSFAELAISYSQDQTAKNGGVVGPIQVKDLPPAIVGVLSQLTPGGLSPLFQIGNYYGFIRLDRLVTSQLDQQTYQLLLDELFDNWIKAQLPTPPELALVPPATISTEATADHQIFAPNFSSTGIG